MIYDYMVYAIMLWTLAWFIVPTVRELMGWNYKRNMDVYNDYTNLLLGRRYAQHKKILDSIK